jgi:hypothetical protein
LQYDSQVAKSQRPSHDRWRGTLDRHLASKIQDRQCPTALDRLAASTAFRPRPWPRHWRRRPGRGSRSRHLCLTPTGLAELLGDFSPSRKSGRSAATRKRGLILFRDTAGRRGSRRARRKTHRLRSCMKENKSKVERREKLTSTRLLVLVRILFSLISLSLSLALIGIRQKAHQRRLSLSSLSSFLKPDATSFCGQYVNVQIDRCMAFAVECIGLNLAPPGIHLLCRGITINLYDWGYSGRNSTSL